MGTGAFARPPGAAGRSTNPNLEAHAEILTEYTMTAKVTGLIPMAHSANVQRSIDFYRLLGMEVRGSLRNPSGELQWVHLACERADLMLTRASEHGLAGHHSVLFYLYSSDLVVLRDHLLENRVNVSPIA